MNKRSTSDDIKYDEMLVVAYHTNIEGLFQLHGEKPIILQVRKPVAHIVVDLSRQMSLVSVLSREGGASMW